MNKWAGIMLCAGSLVAGIPAAALADSDRDATLVQREAEKQQRRVATQTERREVHASRRNDTKRQVDSRRQLEAKWTRWKHEKGVPATAVPELDPGLAGSASCLLFVALALFIERRRNVSI